MLKNIFGPRRLAVLAAAVATTAAFAGPVTPASASVTSALVLRGTATLPQFPCAANPCTGGVFAGTVTGVAVTTSPTGAVVFNGAPIDSQFNYTESCAALAGRPVAPPEGTAGTNDGLGAFQINSGAAHPAGQNGADGTFNWTRVGLTAVILTANVHVYLAGGGTATAVLPDLGVSIFVPSMPIGNCATAQSPQNATVIGADVSAA